MDKYANLYGCEKISELLGLDKAALDFSSEREDQRLKKDCGWSALWVEKVLKMPPSFFCSSSL